RCLGGYTQNSNESFNNILWRIAPKNTNSSSTIVETAAYLAVSIFNEGAPSLMKVMAIMRVAVG
ncbi:hypothetical protein EAG_12347, partial [Camponotus floridanus]